LDFGFWILDFGLQIADCRLQIADCRLQIADCRLQIADLYICIQSQIGNQKSAIKSAARRVFPSKKHPQKKSFHFAEEAEALLRNRSVVV
jgi:hypothetical protein